MVTGTTCNVLLRDIVYGLDASFPRGYPFTNVVMVACDGLGEFCVVLRAVLFLFLNVLRPVLFLLVLYIAKVAYDYMVWVLIRRFMVWPFVLQFSSFPF